MSCRDSAQVVMKSSMLTLVTIMLALINLNRYSCLETEKIGISSEFLEDNSTDWLSYSHSPVDLFYLSNFEEELFAIIKEYIAKSDSEPDYFLKRYIADYEESTLVAFKGWNGTSETKKHFLINSNPLWSYRMIWRFVTDLPLISNILNSSSDAEILTKLENITDPYFIWPSERDLSSSMDSLLNLHDIYDLNLTEFVNGNISNVATNASLSAIHCFEIAQHALRTNRQFTLAIEWLHIAENKRLNLHAHPILDFLENVLVSELLEDIIKEHDDVWIEEPPSAFNLDQYVSKIDSEYELTTQKSLAKLQYNSKGGGTLHPSLNDIIAFSTLCQGGNLQSEKEKSELYCWYESRINPTWYINPQKIELYSKDPLIYQVYDFIADETTIYLMKEAIPVMERSQVSNDINNPEITNPKEKDHRYSNTRTSMYSWLDEIKEAPRLLTLSKRIGYLTGLEASWGFKIPSSSVQIAIYATGGYFNIHVDSLETTADYNDLVDKNIGDRLATFMLYLSDVELGGNTAFTSVGVAVPPVKGSAVFWYDSKYNGDVDYKTWHGGCPVLLGEKWVANKWIYNYPNIFKRKCTLNKDE